MAEIRYIVAIKKAAKDNSSALSGALIASAMALSNHPAMLFAWTGSADENESMARTTMLVIMTRGQMSILFGADTEKDFIEFLKRSIANKVTLSIFITSQITDGPGVQKSGPHLGVVGRVSSGLQDNNGGHVFNFTDVKLPYDPTALAKQPPLHSLPILVPFTHPLLRPPLPAEKGKSK